LSLDFRGRTLNLVDDLSISEALKSILRRCVLVESIKQVLEAILNASCELVASRTIVLGDFLKTELLRRSRVVSVLPVITDVIEDTFVF
jgi:hypothetical protein